jgi:hypothetical protein
MDPRVLSGIEIGDESHENNSHRHGSLRQGYQSDSETTRSKNYKYREVDGDQSDRNAFENSDSEYRNLLRHNIDDDVLSVMDHETFGCCNIFYRLCHAIVAGLTYGLALLLMLIAMTYNRYLFLSLIIGYMLGDFLFYSKMRKLSGSDCHS